MMGGSLNPDMVGTTLSSLKACCDSIAYWVNEVTPEQAQSLEAIYDQLLPLQQEIACGIPRSPEGEAPALTTRSPAEITKLISDLNRWVENRKRKNLPVGTLKLTLACLLDYRDVARRLSPEASSNEG